MLTIKYRSIIKSVQLLQGLSFLCFVAQGVAAGVASAKTPVAVAAHAAQATQKITLGDKLATINLSPEFVFLDEKTAKELLKQEGGNVDNVLGVIAPARGDKSSYFVICEFDKVGHVSDEDADKLNADEILKSYKEGTQESNEERKNLNLPPIYVGNWAEKPHYVKAKHEVIWALQVKEEDSEKAPVVSINYNTRILGRQGVLSLNLVTDPSKLDENKKQITTLLNETTLNPGHAYADFIPGKDKAAEYGIAGLILGGGAAAAAAKLGVFGALSKWFIAALLVLKKFILVGVAGVAGIFSKLFGKKKQAGTTTASNPSPVQLDDNAGDNPIV